MSQPNQVRMGGKFLIIQLSRWCNTVTKITKILTIIYPSKGWELWTKNLSIIHLSISLTRCKVSVLQIWIIRDSQKICIIKKGLFLKEGCKILINNSRFCNPIEITHLITTAMLQIGRISRDSNLHLMWYLKV